MKINLICSTIVNGEMIVHCTHDEAVNILRNAGDLIMLTVKYYRAATPFLKKDGNNGYGSELNVRKFFYSLGKNLCRKVGRRIE